MIAKKSKQADLERKRFAFFQIGLVVAGAATLLAFEYKSVRVDEKELVVNEAPVWRPVDIDLPVEMIETRPQPQQSSLQTEPVDEVTIAKNTGEVGKTLTSIIIVNDPCDGCEEVPFIVDDPKAGEIFIGSDVDPSFPGGYEAMMKFIQNELVVPQICRDMGEGGLVYVDFVVNTDGSITQVKCANEVNPALMKEAVRVVGSMPRWSPGENAGKKVRVRYTIPINVVVQ